MTDEIVGIDLGTTNSEIAVYRDGRPEILADEQGRKILPSVVGVTEAGELLVGEEARNQWLLYPDRTVRSIKRRMGQAETVRMADHDYTPQEISAIILKRLKEIAERRLERPVRKAVITVPAYFSDTQRQATREAGEIAGLEVVRIINEPTAAALVYEAGQHQGKRILVYDLGGGTFDVSVVRIEEGVVEVISSHGNNHLGGDDFDQKIVAHILEQLKIKQGVDVSDEPRAMTRILRAAEAAKRHLSDHPYARIEEEYLTGADAQAGSPVARTGARRVRTDDRAVRGGDPAGHPQRAAGGRSDRLAGRGNPAGRRRHAHADDPASPARGVCPRAARRGGCRSVRGDGRGDPGCGDRRRRGLRRAGRCDALYVRHQRDRRTRWGAVSLSLRPDHRRATRRSRCARARRSSPSVDDQTEVDVRIYQGEDADALENIKIGEFRIEGLSKAPAGNPVVLDLALDRDGILHVAALEKNTGLERRISIDQAVARYGAAELQQAKERIGSLFGQDDADMPMGAGRGELRQCGPGGVAGQGQRKTGCGRG